eukprot:1156863-Pelagomonas_calceolata.AAC.11
MKKVSRDPMHELEKMRAVLSPMFFMHSGGYDELFRLLTFFNSRAGCLGGMFGTMQKDPPLSDEKLFCTFQPLKELFVWV